MKKFEEEYDKFHNENHNQFDTATGYHRALKQHFKDVVFPEDYQQVAKALGNTTDKLDCAEERVGLLESTVDELKSQLEKQKPEIPEFVADVVDKYKKSPIFFPNIENMSGEVINWLNEYQFKDERFGLRGINNKMAIIVWLAIAGYTVAKEKRLYLKHIDMSKRNSINDLYLKKYIHADLTENGELRLAHAMSAKGTYPSKDYCAFTQQEIDSMETGSYEQIPVEEKNG